ncbi:unnamed protein product [Chondrus crispus]|uniref:Uncharacterized protein n=1 Tax=Chondrus crispus TaxID=2769 RepID=R7QR25_CHOCR|nr:unnamed protein product [Chondrus crispus]CDF40937.1 unnamed protein product [Chondrus crispus]|eukprot:XP_005711231.1 unnamed protein product [Chondrus crispus]
MESRFSPVHRPCPVHRDYASNANTDSVAHPNRFSYLFIRDGNIPKQNTH